MAAAGLAGAEEERAERSRGTGPRRCAGMIDADEAAVRRSDDEMFVAYLRPFARMGLKAIPMRAETGPIGGDLSHEFIVLADTGESAVYCDKEVLNLPVPGEEIDYEGDLTPIIKQWTSVYAATEDVHNSDRFDREVLTEN